jgi:hypothetical protein
MPRQDRGNRRLAAPDAIPPTASSYWVVPGRLLAGAYPGDSDPEAHRAKVQSLVDAGIRTFVNLMEVNETNYAGEPFVPYQNLARQLCPDAHCCRHAIRDLAAPTPELMTAILGARPDHTIVAFNCCLSLPRRSRRTLVFTKSVKIPLNVGGRLANPSKSGGRQRNTGPPTNTKKRAQ